MDRGRLTHTEDSSANPEDSHRPSVTPSLAVSVTGTDLARNQTRDKGFSLFQRSASPKASSLPLSCTEQSQNKYQGWNGPPPVHRPWGSKALHEHSVV